MKPITRVKKVVAFKTDFGTLYEDLIQSSKGTTGEHIRWNYNKPAVVVVPRKNDKLAMSSVFRYPIGSYSLEFPRGGVENGENVIEAAKRELMEEMGLISKNCNLLGKLCPETGFIDTCASIILIDTKSGNAQKENGPMEMIGEPQWMQIQDIEQKIKKGNIKCSISIAAFTIYKCQNDLN